MISSTKYLSSFEKITPNSTLSEFEFEKFDRTYPGGYGISFVLALSSCLDFNIKDFSKFYLTNNFRLLDIFKKPDKNLKKTNIYTTLKVDDYYLDYEELDARNFTISLSGFQTYKYFKSPTMKQLREEKVIGNRIVESGKKYNILLKESNLCNITVELNDGIYYLCNNEDGDLFFCKESILTFDSSIITPQDFKYNYSDSNNSLIFYKKINTNTLYLTKNSTNELILSNVTENDISKITSNPFIIEESIFINNEILSDNAFISYTPNNDINTSKIEEHLSNNILLHSENNLTNAIVLKNQLSQNDIFTSGDNMLSGNGINYYINDFRSYTNISKGIQDDGVLILNYVFHNKPYLIKSGKNTILSPDNMRPFEKININDTKFIECGAYSGDTPKYADKVYKTSPNNTLYDNNQYLLCTWLSGSPFGNEKIWMDRYYYPDLIEKETALSAKNTFNITYEDLDEIYVRENVANLLKFNKIYDKISDLCFESSSVYIYERNNKTPTPPTNLECDNRFDYYQIINESSKFTLAFTFDGDKNEWEIYSDRNDIDSGVNIVKNSDSLSISFKIYDPENFNYENNFYSKTITAPFLPNKDNFICISLDAVSGNGYALFNNTIIGEFDMGAYEFSSKQILHGNFYISYGTQNEEILISEKIKNLIINSEYSSPNDAFFLNINNTAQKIDDIVITLPCGARNSMDEIDILQSFRPDEFQSNNINIYIKNTGIVDDTTMESIKLEILPKIKNYIPINAETTNIFFKEYI